MLNIAGYTIKTLVPESLWLDGGAMFGLVPKTIWSKLIPVDEKNRIELSCRLLLLEGNGRKILVDLGVGRKWNEKFKGIYKIVYHTSQALHELVPDVTDIILTHLHFDHCGGISVLNQAGISQLTFPKANIYLQQQQFDHSETPGVRDSASFLKENQDPLKTSKLQLLNGEQEIFPGIKCFIANGHTKGLQWLLIEGPEGNLAYPSDLIPTSRHIPASYVMGYDLHAEQSIEEKRKFLERAVAEDWIVVFEHDPDLPACRIIRDPSGRFVRGETVNIPEFMP
jgi:glyoxylase-like metal-dependent hydrolase (beta-lactamase superfamily II)